MSIQQKLNLNQVIAEICNELLYDHKLITIKNVKDLFIALYPFHSNQYADEHFINSINIWRIEQLNSYEVNSLKINNLDECHDNEYNSNEDHQISYCAQLQPIALNGNAVEGINEINKVQEGGNELNRGTDEINEINENISNEPNEDYYEYSTNNYCNNEYQQYLEYAEHEYTKINYNHIEDHNNNHKNNFMMSNINCLYEENNRLKQELLKYRREAQFLQAKIKSINSCYNRQRQEFIMKIERMLYQVNKNHK